MDQCAVIDVLVRIGYEEKSFKNHITKIFKDSFLNIFVI